MESIDITYLRAFHYVALIAMIGMLLLGPWWARYACLTILFVTEFSFYKLSSSCYVYLSEEEET